MWARCRTPAPSRLWRRGRTARCQPGSTHGETTARIPRTSPIRSTRRPTTADEQAADPPSRTGVKHRRAVVPTGPVGGGPRGAAARGPGRRAGTSVGTPRWRRIRSQPRPRMRAIRRRRPPQLGRASTSNPKVRCIKAAHCWPRTRHCAVSAGSLPTAATISHASLGCPVSDLPRRTTSEDSRV